jgi:glucose-1-phosphate thymidylyltransferase
MARSTRPVGATIFGYRVADPERFHLVCLAGKGKALSMSKRPKDFTPKPGDHRALASRQTAGKYSRQYCGLGARRADNYLCTPTITEKRPNSCWSYRAKDRLARLRTADSPADAANSVRALENRQGARIFRPELIALEKGFINRDQLAQLGPKFGESDYGKYLLRVAEEHS